jgi:hypothetical protein
VGLRQNAFLGKRNVNVLPNPDHPAHIGFFYRPCGHWKSLTSKLNTTDSTRTLIFHENLIIFAREIRTEENNAMERYPS